METSIPENYDKNDLKCCGIRFTSKKSIKIHWYRTHRIKPKCDICNKTFNTEIMATKHMKIIHGLTHKLEGNQKTFHCDVCNKTFSSKYNMKRHFEDVHMKLRKVKCKICEKTYSTKRSLKIHIEGIHSKKPRVDCDMCGKNFANEQTLDYHKKTIHVISKPVQYHLQLRYRNYHLG